jgi:ABC-type amino acid transport substrate-binding protein
MNHTLKLFLFFILFIQTLIASDIKLTKEEQNWIKQNKTVKVAMLNNFEPFSYIQDDIHQGYTVDILKEISKISGLKLDLQTSRWTPALNSFKEKQTDIITGISYKKSRESFTLFSEPYYEIPTFIFGLKSDTHYTNNKSLIGKKVAVSKNIFYIDALKKLGIKVVEVDSSIQKANALVTKEVDYFLASYTTGMKSIKKQSLYDVKPMDELTSIKKEDLRFGINKDKPILHSIIQKSLKQIDAQTLKNLANKWILNNTSQELSTINFTQEELNYINSNPTIKIGSIDSYTPFSFIQDNQKVGFTQDIIDIISKKSGLNFQKVGGTWPEVFGKFKNAQIDMISELSYRTERLKFTSYTKPYFEIPIGVFTRGDFGIYEGINSLKGKKVGIVKNSYLVNVLKNIKEIDVVEVDTTDGRFFALRDKKVDVVLSNALSMYRVEKLMIQGIKLSGIFNHPDAKSEDLRFGINKNKQILASIINKTLDSIAFSTMSALKQEWILENTNNHQTSLLSHQTNMYS